jgi:hypothetical protein
MKGTMTMSIAGAYFTMTKIMKGTMSIHAVG